MADITESFIANINKIAQNLDAIIQSNKNYDPDSIVTLKELAGTDLDLIMEDLKKGNYLGNRKIDIDLLANNESTTEECSYSQADIVLNNGVTIEIPFETVNEMDETVVAEITSYSALYTKITEAIAAYNLTAAEQLKVVNYEIDVINETLEDQNTVLRVRDTDGSACNIDRISLYYYNGGTPIETMPSYYWAKSTSSLEVLSNRVGDLISLGNRIDKIVALSDEVHASLDNISLASQKAQEVADIRDQILAINPSVVMISSDQSASLVYNATTGAYILYMPQGLKGERGDAFKVNAIGTFAQRSLHDDEVIGFSFLAADVEVDGSVIPHIYFKKSSTSGDWSVGTPFGRGEKGDSIQAFEFVSSTDSSNEAGVAGATDTYQVKLDTGEIIGNIVVTNGAIPTKEDLGLENVDNTSDENKPISTAAQAAFDSIGTESDFTGALA